MATIDAKLENNSNERRSGEFLALSLSEIMFYMKGKEKWPEDGMLQFLSNYRKELMTTIKTRCGEDERDNIRHVLNKLFYSLAADDMIDPEKVKNSEIYQKIQKMPLLNARFDFD